MSKFFYEELDGQLHGLLAPMVAEGLVRRIETEEFSTADDVRELMPKLRSISPAAFLSSPIESLERPGGSRVRSSELQYFLLIGLKSRETAAERRHEAWRVRDRIVELLDMAKLETGDLPTAAPLDFVEVTRIELTSGDENMTALLVGFVVRVRNIQTRALSRV